MKLILAGLVFLPFLVALFFFIRSFAQKGKTEGMLDFSTKSTPEEAIRKSKEASQLIEDEKEQARRDLKKAANTYDRLKNNNE